MAQLCRVLIDDTEVISNTRALLNVSIASNSNVNIDASRINSNRINIAQMGRGVYFTDDRDVKPVDTPKGYLSPYFTTLGGLTGASGGNYQDFLVLNTFTDTTGGSVNALAFDKKAWAIRHYRAGQGDSTWGIPKTLAYWEDVSAVGKSGNLSDLTVDADKDMGGKALYNVNSINGLSFSADATEGRFIAPSNQLIFDSNVGGAYPRSIVLRRDAFGPTSGTHNMLDLGRNLIRWKDGYFSGIITTSGVVIDGSGTVDGVDVSTHNHDGTATGGVKISYNNLNDKPFIPLALGELTQSTNYRTVTDAQIAEFHANHVNRIYLDSIDQSLSSGASPRFASLTTTSKSVDGVNIPALEAAFSSHTHTGGADGQAIAYSSLTGRPTLGTAAQYNVGTSANNIPQIGADGVLPASIIPAAALSDVFVVDTIAEMLTLAATKGDWCMVTSETKTYVLGGDDPSVLANWKEILVPSGYISSVNGKSGSSITLDASDIGLGNVTNESKATMFTSPAFTGIPTAPTAAKTVNSTQIATTAYVKSVVADYAPLTSPSFTGNISVTGTVDGIDLSAKAVEWDAKLPLTGGTLSGPLTVLGTAASNSLKVRGIRGCTANGASDDALYLNYNNTKPVYINGENVVWHAGNFNPSSKAESSHTHAATDITQTASYRFVTDTEKAIWNGKQDSLSGDVTGHYHAADRALANATGSLSTTQLSEPGYVLGSVTKTGQPLFDVLRADRTAFLSADQIIIEQSTDGGSTWEPYSTSDAAKTGLFSGTRPNIRIPLKGGVRNVDCMLRITITAMKYDVPPDTPETEKYQYWNSENVLSTDRYCQLTAGWAFVNAVNDRIYCKIEAAKGGSPNSWSLLREVFMSGWSGGNFFSVPSTNFGGGTNQTGNYWNWRFTFRTATTNLDFDNSKLATGSNTQAQSIQHLKLTGPSVWSYSNSMMYHDHIYSWDTNKNTTFPARVTATELYEGGNRVYSPSNKPSKADVGLSNVPNVDATIASNITQDASHRFVTDTEKSIWNSKAAGDHTHSTYNRASSVLSGANVFSNIVVVNGIVTNTATRALTAANIGAAASVHTHAAADVTESATKKFVTDAQIAEFHTNHSNRASLDTINQSLGTSHSPTFAALNLSNTNTKILKGTDNMLRIQTPGGYGDIGPKNNSHFHLYTDRPNFYFDKPIWANGNVDPYSDALVSLGNSSKRWKELHTSGDANIGGGINMGAFRVQYNATNDCIEFVYNG
jgi:hypothetical protein